MEHLYLQDIYIYPIKSLGGISVHNAEVQERGLKYDRRWMLVDKEGNFLSQRTYPQMAMLQVTITDTGLLVSHKNNQLAPLAIPFEQTTNKHVIVNIWDDTCPAIEVSPQADAWFTDALQMTARLVYMPLTTKRLVDPDYASNLETVSFADAYPFLIIGQSSLDDLNNRLNAPVLMNRFRPNFVFSGGTPYCEDGFVNFNIGEVGFKGVKLCARCVLTTVEQETAFKGSEPLKTLSTYRVIKNKVIFGQNLLALNSGLVQVGDKLELL